MVRSQQVAIVTGAGQGVGKAIAARFVAQSQLAVIAEVDELAADGTVPFLQTDVSREEQAKDMTARAVERLGRIDNLINNAGISRRKSIAERALTHALAMSLGPAVRVNSISPGWIQVHDCKKRSERTTPQLMPADHTRHPVGRAGKPEDIAELVAYLCSDKAGFISGQDFVVDGGMTKKMIYLT